MKKKERASIFDATEESEIDISAFAPKSATSLTGPSPEQVRAVSEAANFRSREPIAKSPAKPKREPRRYRTGRNVQFNLKVLQDTVDRFYAICDKKEWVMGYTLERAVTALERELAEP